MKFAKPSRWLVELFDALLPEVGGEHRQMFGCPVGFENGQMFAGVFADTLFVRLEESGRASLLESGGRPFEPMKGRPMREYVVLPPAMVEDEEAVKEWMRRALAYARSLPKKPKKAPRAAAKKKR